MMRNRVPKEALPILNEKELSKRGRGASQLAVRQDEKFCIVKWFDNKCITLGSSCHSTQPQDTCRRWDRKQKKYISVTRPDIVNQYNANMGGVDLMDRMISYYRISARTKKWTIRCFMHFFDLAVANSWILYCQDKARLRYSKKDIMKFVDFRLDLAEKFLTDGDREQGDANNSGDETVQIAKRRFTPVPSAHHRVSAAKHMPEVAQVKSAMRCRNLACKHKTMIRCKTCDMFLCLTGSRNCFAQFHKK